MTPTEHDLRAALHAGEGAGVDAGAIMDLGRSRQAQRRTRITSAAVVAAFVAAVGTGGAFLYNDGSGTSSGDANSAGSALRAQSSSALPASAGGGVGATPSKAARAVTASCPSSFPRRLLPGGGSPGQFGSDRPLFAEPVVSLLVCGYGTAAQAPNSVPAQLVLAGTRAQEVVRSLETAATKPPANVCVGPPGRPERRFAIVGFTATGARLPVITTTLGGPPCGQPLLVTTNGTAIRYGWTPPGVLSAILTSLTPRVARPSGQPTGSLVSPGSGVRGSPIRS